MDTVNIHTDGSCLGNPGPGGWGAILQCREHFKKISGGEPQTTNNRMELTAVISGLKMLNRACNVTIITDSRYVTEAFNKGWIFNWEKEGFKDRKNRDLWIELLTLYRMHNVKFNWIKGHAGNTYNEECDKMAQEQAKRQ